MMKMQTEKKSHQFLNPSQLQIQIQIKKHQQNHKLILVKKFQHKLEQVLIVFLKDKALKAALDL